MNSKGNIIILIAFIITALLGVCGLAVDSSMYMLKRAKLQSLAKSISLIGAQYLPDEKLALEASKAWYNILKYKKKDFSNNKLEIKINNSNKNKVDSLTISITSFYKPKIFSSLKKKIRVRGNYTARIKKSNIIFIIDNSPIKNNKITNTPTIFNRFFTKEVSNRFLAECFSSFYIDFKKFILKIYDELSPLSSLKTKVLFLSSKENTPYFLSKFNSNYLNYNSIPFNKDEPYSPNTRCGLLTNIKKYNVPSFKKKENTNRKDISKLIDLSKGNNFLGLKKDKKISIKEYIWISSFATSTDSGFIHPRYYKNLKTNYAINLSIKELKSLAKNSNSKTKENHIVLFSKDINNLFTKNISICSTHKNNLKENNIKLIIILLENPKSIYKNKELTKRKNLIKRLKKECRYNENNILFIKKELKETPFNKNHFPLTKSISNLIKGVEIEK